MTKEFDKRNAAKSRKVCEAMAEAASTGKRVLSEREKLILDRWPKFEDGECVWFGDAYIDTDGDANKVRAIEFDEVCTDLVGIEGFHTGFFAGERVKRPAPKVLDADGVEIKVGDTVWFKGNPRPYAVVEVKDGSVRLHSKTHCSEESATTVWTDILTHIAPDSWEQLEEDAAKEPCDYFGVECDDDKGCSGCPHLHEGRDCAIDLQADIVRRAKELAGVEAGR